MKILMDRKRAAQVGGLRLPRYRELPDVGLYLKQTVKYVNDVLEPLHQSHITETMISNYVKMRLIPSPVQKRYDRDQLAHILFILLAKNVLSMENIALMLKMQLATHETGKAYDFFCRCLERELRREFSLEPSPELEEWYSARTMHDRGLSNDETHMLQIMISTVAQIIYLEFSFTELRTNGAE